MTGEDVLHPATNPATSHIYTQVNGEDVAPTKEAIMKAAGAAMKKGKPRTL